MMGDPVTEQVPTPGSNEEVRDAYRLGILARTELIYHERSESAPLSASEASVVAHSHT